MLKKRSVLNTIIVLIIIIPLLAFSFIADNVAVSKLKNGLMERFGNKINVSVKKYSGSINGFHSFKNVALGLEDEKNIQIGEFSINEEENSSSIIMNNVKINGNPATFPNCFNNSCPSKDLKCTINNLSFNKDLVPFDSIDSIRMEITKGKISIILQNNSTQIVVRNFDNKGIRENFIFHVSNLKMDEIKNLSSVIDGFIRKMTIKGVNFNTIENFDIYGEISGVDVKKKTVEGNFFLKAYQKDKTESVISLIRDSKNEFLKFSNIRFQYKNNDVYINGTAFNRLGRFSLNTSQSLMENDKTEISVNGSFDLREDITRPVVSARFSTSSKTNKLLNNTGHIKYEKGRITLSSSTRGKLGNNLELEYDTADNRLEGFGDVFNSTMLSTFRINNKNNVIRINGVANLKNMSYGGKNPELNYSLGIDGNGSFSINNLPWINKKLNGRISIKNDHAELTGKEINLEIRKTEDNPCLIIKGDGRIKTLMGDLNYKITSVKNSISITGNLENSLISIPVSYDLNYNTDKKIIAVKNISMKKYLKINGELKKNTLNLDYNIDGYNLFSNASDCLPKIFVNKYHKLFLETIKEIGSVKGKVKYSKDELVITGNLNDSKSSLKYKNGNIIFSNFPLKDISIDGFIDINNSDNANLKITPLKNSEIKNIFFGLFNYEYLNVKSVKNDNKYFIKINGFKNMSSTEIVDIDLILNKGIFYFTRLEAHLGDYVIEGSGNINSDGHYNGKFVSGEIRQEILDSLGLPKLFKGFKTAKMSISGKNGEFTYKTTLSGLGLYSNIYDNFNFSIEPLKDKGFIVKTDLVHNNKILGNGHFFTKNINKIDFNTLGFIELRNFKPGESMMGKENLINPGNINARIDIEVNKNGFSSKGNASFTNGYVRNSHSIILKDLNGKAKIEDGKIVLVNTSARHDSELIDLSGWVNPVSENRKAVFNIETESTKLTLKKIFKKLKNIELESDSDLTVKLNINNKNGYTEVSGVTFLSNGVLHYSDLEIVKSLENKDNLRFDLAVNLDENIKLKNTIFDAITTGQINVSNDNNNNLSVTGNIVTNSGRFNYLGKNFSIENGELNISTLESSGLENNVISHQISQYNSKSTLNGFTNYNYHGIKHGLYLNSMPKEDKNRIKTVINLKGKRRGKGKEFFIHINGEMSNLNTSFTSNPEMASEDIERSLFGIKLSAGSSDSDAMMNGYNNNNNVMDFLGSQVQSVIWNKIGESLEQQFNLDEFSIKAETEDEVNPFMSDLEINIGKYVNKDLFVSYSKNVVDSRQDSLGMEYKVGKNVFLGGQFNKKNQLSMDARLGVSF